MSLVAVFIGFLSTYFINLVEVDDAEFIKSTLEMDTTNVIVEPDKLIFDEHGYNCTTDECDVFVSYTMPDEILEYLIEYPDWVSLELYMDQDVLYPEVSVVKHGYGINVLPNNSTSPRSCHIGFRSTFLNVDNEYETKQGDLLIEQKGKGQ